MTQENIHPSINAFIYCPNCGHHKLKNESGKMIECYECSFTFYLNPSSAVAIIIENEKDEILFSIRAMDPQIGKLDLPGGFVDPFETLENAIIRESLEELNLRFDSISYLGSKTNIYPFKGVIYQTVDAVFYTQINKDQKISVSDEIKEIVWLMPEDIDVSQIAFSSIRNIISEFIEKK